MDSSQKIQNVILIPLNMPHTFSSYKDLLNPSTTKRKRRGANGYPCIIPFLGLNNSYVDPLIRTTNETVWTQLITQFSKVWENTTCIKINQIYNQLNLEYSLERSSFRIIVGFVLSLKEWKISQEIPTTSCIFLPARKPNF